MAVETEIKYQIVCRRDLESLLGPGGLGEAQGRERQENIYLDTLGLLLARSLVMLRLRVRDVGVPLLTLKSGTEEEEGLFRSLEIEAALPPDLLPELLARPDALYGLELPPVAELCARFGQPALSVIGTLITERARLEAGGHRVELDRMTFPDGSEAYEVEIETGNPAEARAWLEGQLRRLGVQAAPSRLTKYARLVRWLEARGERSR